MTSFFEAQAGGVKTSSGGERASYRSLSHMRSRACAAKPTQPFYDTRFPQGPGFTGFGCAVSTIITVSPIESH